MNLEDNNPILLWHCTTASDLSIVLIKARYLFIYTLVRTLHRWVKVSYHWWKRRKYVSQFHWVILTSTLYTKGVYVQQPFSR